MLGLGETDDEICETMDDLRARGRGHPDARPVPAPDRESPAGASGSSRRRSSRRTAPPALARGFRRMRRGPAGALELPRRAGARRATTRAGRGGSRGSDSACDAIPRPVHPHSLRYRRCAASRTAARPALARAASSTSPPGARCSAQVDTRGPDTPDEIWFLEHPPVFTLGMNARPEHLLATGDIPVVQIDRGGQVTYHGPGQLVVYPLIDLGRAGLGVRALVEGIERAIIATLRGLGIEAVGAARRARRLRRPAARSRASACASAARARTTGSRSTSPWTSSRSAASIPAATRGCR